LHAGGLIHRDIKPSNIFVCDWGGHVETTKLLDFGLIKVTNDPYQSDLTQDGEILGTPAFMSPEQASAQPVDVRTDIYSLGTVAYFMLTGQPPFVRPTMVETLNAHIREGHVSLSQVRNDIDGRLADVVDRCLAKDPEYRFASVLEFEQSLAPFQMS
jgi:serine/threonine-protein kinase